MAERPHGPGPEPPWADRTDAELLVDPDPAAFGQLYDRHVASLLRFFVRRTACSHAAADLTAETFAEALQSRGRYDPERGEVAAWLYGIARNRLRRYARKGSADQRTLRRIGLSASAWSSDELDRVDELIDLERLRGHVVEGLSRLSPALRTAVELRVIEDLPYRQVAERLGCSEGAARVRVTRALTRLADAELETAWRGVRAEWTPT